MSLLRGNVSLRRFMVLGVVPELNDLLSGLTCNAFKSFGDGQDEERVGWCDWRNLLVTPPDIDWVIYERFAIFGMRLDTRRVPSTLLRALVDARIDNIQQGEKNTFVSKDMRASIQDEVKSELLTKVLPTPRVSEIVWDLKGGLLLTTASSGGAQSALVSLFTKSFGCELQSMVPLVVASRLLQNVSMESMIALKPLDIAMMENT